MFIENGFVFAIFLKNTPGAALGGALRAPPRPEEAVFCFKYVENRNKISVFEYLQNIGSNSHRGRVFKHPRFPKERKLPLLGVFSTHLEGPTGHIQQKYVFCNLLLFP